MGLISETATAPIPFSAVVRHEENPDFCREVKTLLAGSGAVRALLLGTVVGLAALGAASAVAGGSNTGDGSMGAITLGDDAELGGYVLTVTSASSDAGAFELVTPNGVRLPDGNVAAAYASEHLNFTLADGAADFVVGDTFTITVADGTGKATAVDASKVDGTEDAYGVVIRDAEAPDEADEIGRAHV